MDTTIHVVDASAAHGPIEAVHVLAVQNEGLPVASFIAALTLVRHAVAHLLTMAYAAPACVPALTCMRTNIPVPRSVIPSVMSKKIGAKMAASTIAVPSRFLNRWPRTRIILSPTETNGGYQGWS